MNSSRSRVIRAHQVVLCADDYEVIAPAAPALRHWPSAEAAGQSTPLPFVDTPAGPAISPQVGEVQQALLTAAVAQGQQVLWQSRREAAEIVRQAKEEAAEIAQQARQAGLAAAEAETGELLFSAKGVYDEVRAWRESMLAAGEEAVLSLVAAVAHIIFGEGLALDAGTLKSAFARALAEAKPLGDLRVHVHPDDDALLDPHWPQQQSALIGQRLELVPDPAVRRGGCLVEGQYGSVDARVETQMQVALDAVFAASPAAAPGDAPAVPLPRIGSSAEAEA
ncbi:MAG: hypothetical protein HY260_04985 [Chloroflexi bacterium]|nr:hypothetical protein [Chloroflexota bacterium]